jgi:hypothetical protein
VQAGAARDGCLTFCHGYLPFVEDG